MSGPTAPGPFEWLQDVQRRPQETIPTIFGCKRAFFEKCRFSCKKTKVFEGRVAKLPGEHPPFVALRPPPRAIWTDVRSSYPWATLPPAPHEQKKTFGNSLWDFVSRGEGPHPFFTIPPSDAVWAPRGQEASRGLFWNLFRPHLGISGGLS